MIPVKVNPNLIKSLSSIAYSDVALDIGAEHRGVRNSILSSCGVQIVQGEFIKLYWVAL